MQCVCIVSGCDLPEKRRKDENRALQNAWLHLKRNNDVLSRFPPLVEKEERRPKGEFIKPRVKTNPRVRVTLEFDGRTDALAHACALGVACDLTVRPLRTGKTRAAKFTY
jgi:hypothetical protein